MPRYKHIPLEDITEPPVNLTPLIDVVFVVLIIFIVIAPLLNLDQVELADSNFSDQKTSLRIEENAPLSIYVRADNTILLNGRKVQPKELLQYMKAAKQKFPTVTPQLFHDRNASFGTYQSIKNAAESAGFKQLDVILKP